ncbi:MAG: TlpA disulfide reductase family protein [Halothiobacillus sp.]|jgi:thiol-disulfide isomerase/thioredoxin|nr:TlpA disulfide reductase family protein [Halothiobacillus sp.]
MPSVISFGGLLISTPRLAFVIAVLAGMVVTPWLARRCGADRSGVERLGELFILTILLAARAGFAVRNWAAYRHAPWTTLYLWQPGYNIWAGIAGALFFIAIGAISWPRVNMRQPTRLLAQGFTVPLLAFLGFHLMLPLWQRTGQLGAGKPVPSLAMQNLDQQPVALKKFVGHPLVVNLWATWCLPCREEIPLLNQAYRHFADRDLTIVGMDLAEKPLTVRRFVAQRPIAYPVWTDPTDIQSHLSPSRTLFQSTGGLAIPTTLFIDCKGIIRDVQVGKLNSATLYSNINRILC